MTCYEETCWVSAACVQTRRHKRSRQHKWERLGNTAIGQAISQDQPYTRAVISNSSGTIEDSSGTSTLKNGIRMQMEHTHEHRNFNDCCYRIVPTWPSGVKQHGPTATCLDTCSLGDVDATEKSWQLQRTIESRRGITRCNRGAWGWQRAKWGYDDARETKMPGTHSPIVRFKSKRTHGTELQPHGTTIPTACTHEFQVHAGS